VSPYHSRSGVHWVQALIAQAMGNPNSRSAAVAAFLAAAKTPFANPDLTLGTSGVLLAAARMVEAIPGERRLREFGSSLLARSARRIGRGPRYAGMAHGWAGVIYAWMSWHRAAGDPLPASAHEVLSVLAERPCGRMAGWCHGSAGFVHLWTLAHSLLRDARYIHLAESAAWHVWKNGAGLGTLCCGLAGQSYALLNFYKHTGVAEWLPRAQDLAERAAARVSSCERFTSLYQGAVGAAVLAADLARPEAACMPLFEPEGWS
jgi:eukaryotic-like serine/threonine-protein kinase